jgi:hypothetical protein
MSVEPGIPDPVATANIYCAGHLDHVIFRALKPFRDAAVSSLPGAPLFLWMIRYRKCGEHVKVRVHAKPEYRDGIRSLLERHVRQLFAVLPPSSAIEESSSTKQVIDPEDSAEQPYADRTLLWTSYRRSYVSLGPSPLLEDDRYVELCTRCLAAAADLVFSLESHFSRELPYRYRHVTQLKAVALAMDAAGLSPMDEANYILYHRNWLLRFCLVKNWWTQEQAKRTIDLFDRRMQAQSLLDQASSLRRDVASLLDKKPFQVWRAQVRELFLYSSKMQYHLDPFAFRFEYLPLFKVLHGASNQLGLRHIDEAFLFHIFLAALCKACSLPNLTGYSDSEPEWEVNSQ